MKIKNQLYAILIENLINKKKKKMNPNFLKQSSNSTIWCNLYIFFNEKKVETEFKSIVYFKSFVNPYRLHENMPKSAKKEQSNWDKVLNWANDRIGMACKWEVWGKKRERGKQKDPRQSWEREWELKG